MEIVLFVLGIGAFAASFLIPEKKEKLHEADRRLGEEQIKELVEEQMKEVKTRVYEVVDETITYAVDKAERSMERVSNEKIMAVNEYSDTVLESIHKNHEEVVFLFDMLNDKHQNLRDTAAEVDKKVKETKEITKEAARIAQESSVRAAQESVKAVEESAREAWEAARAALQQVKDAEEDALRQVRDAAEESALLQARSAARNVREQSDDTEKFIPRKKSEETARSLRQDRDGDTELDNGAGQSVEEQSYLLTEDKEADANTVQPSSVEETPAASFTPLQPVELKTEGDKAGEECNILKEEKRKEEKPRKRTPRKAKPSPAVEQKQTDMPPVAISFAANAGEDGKNNNEKILALHKEGKSNIAIARELGLGIGEVKLVIDLFKGV